MKSLRHIFVALLATAFCIGCTQEECANHTPKHGFYYLDEQPIPVESAVIAEGTHLLVKLSPIADNLHATTYAVVGIHTDLVGTEIDVEYRFHNDDYIFIYEDPSYYHGAIRPLQRGTIRLNRTTTGLIDLYIDVVLYDGRTFRYENHALEATAADVE